jgi:Carboxypeptidase regulatory-like domain
VAPNYNSLSGMVRAHGWLFCIAGCTLVMAQPATPPAPQKPGRIEGTVMNSVTGAGVKKAEVMLNGGPSNRGVITDATGHFAFESVAPGQYWLQVNCPGYSFPPGSNGQRPVKVSEEQEVKDLVVRMMPLGVVSGVVRDQDGEPMAHVQIHGLHFVYINGRRELNQTNFSSTNDRGEFRMFDLQPGKYFFQAWPLTQMMGRMFPEGAVSNLSNEVYPATYYPSGVDVSQAAAQEVRAGEELPGVDFRLKKMPSFHIRGHVADSMKTDGGGSIQVYRSGRPVNLGRGLQPDGAFDISSVVPGEYTLVAMKNDSRVLRSARQVVVISDHDVDDVTLTVEAGVTVRGSVTVEGGDLSAVLVVSLENRNASVVAEKIKDDSTFELNNLPPEIYTVNVRGPLAPKYLKSIQFSGQPLPDGLVDLTQQRGGDLQLVLGSDGGKITGTTAPSTQVTATLVDGAVRTDQFHTSMSDPNGNFQFQGLAPGKYLVLAWESNDVNSMQIPDLRKQLAGKGALVTLGANGNESVRVAVIPAAAIAEAIQKLP